MNKFIFILFFISFAAAAETVLQINIKNEIDLKDGNFLTKEEYGEQGRYALITHDHGRFESEEDIMEAVCTDGFLVSKLPTKFGKVKTVLKPTDYVLTKCRDPN